MNINHRYILFLFQFYKPNWKRPPPKEKDEKTKEDIVNTFSQKEKRKLKELDDSMGIVYKGIFAQLCSLILMIALNQEYLCILRKELKLALIIYRSC